MINTVSKINLSKIGGEGGGSTSIWIMSANILGGFYGTSYLKFEDANPMFENMFTEHLKSCLLSIK